MTRFVVVAVFHRSRSETAQNFNYLKVFHSALIHSRKVKISLRKPIRKRYKCVLALREAESEIKMTELSFFNSVGHVIHGTPNAFFVCL